MRRVEGENMTEAVKRLEALLVLAGVYPIDDKITVKQAEVVSDYAKGLPTIKPHDLHIPTNTALHGDYMFDLEKRDIQLFEVQAGGFMFKIPLKYKAEWKKAKGKKESPYVYYSGHKWKADFIENLHGYDFFILNEKIK